MSVVNEYWGIYFKKLRQIRADECKWKFNSGFVVILILVSLLPLKTSFSLYLREFSGLLATIWGGLLGLITAGLAIFFQSLDPKYLVKLYTHKDHKSNLSHLELRLICYIESFVSLFLGVLVFISLYILSYVDFLELLPVVALKYLWGLKLISAGVMGYMLGDGLYHLLSLSLNIYSSTLNQAGALEILGREK